MYQTSWASYVVTEYFGENQSFWCETAMYFIFHNLIILHKWNSIGIVYISSDICFQKPQHFNNIFTEVRPHHFLLISAISNFYDIMYIWTGFSIYVDMICCLLRSASPKRGPSLAPRDVYRITMTNENCTCHICQTNEQAICILSDLMAFVWMEYIDMYLMVE